MRTSTGLIAVIVLFCSTQCICSGKEVTLPHGVVHDVLQVLLTVDKPANATEIRTRLDNHRYRVDSTALIRYRYIPSGSTRTCVLRMYLLSKPVLYVDVWTPDPGSADSSAFKTAMIGVVNWLNIGVVTSKGEFNVMEINASHLFADAERRIVIALASVCCDTTMPIQSTLARLRGEGATVSFERYGRKGDLPLSTTPVTHLVYSINDSYRLWLQLKHVWSADSLRGDMIPSDTWVSASNELPVPRREGDLVADVTPYGSELWTLHDEDVVRTVFK